jgi:hypothetical protein
VGPVVTGKRARARLAKSELLVMLAVQAEQWHKMLLDQQPGILPFAKWPDDDPLRMLCRTYDLSPADLAKLADQIGAEIEHRAERAGYADHWDPR